MIQRIQSLYLLITIVSSVVLFFYAQGTEETSLVVEYYLLLITPVLSAVVLFLFKRRMLQVRLCAILIFFQLSLIGFYGYSYALNTQLTLTYPVVLGSIVHFVFLWMARRSILKDEALVRSVDRIR